MFTNFFAVSEYRFAKRTILHCKTATFGAQNWQFWNAKVAVLEYRSGSFRMQKWQFWKLTQIALEFNQLSVWFQKVHYTFIIIYLSRNRIVALMFPSPPLGEAGWGF